MAQPLRGARAARNLIIAALVLGATAAGAADMDEVETMRVGGDSFHVGISAVQRIGLINTSFRLNSSFRSGEEDSEQSSEGTLFLAEASWSPPHSRDLLYGTAFWGYDRYVSAARDPEAGGPLQRAGILFEAPGLGRFGSALSSDAIHVVGGAIGYQKFFDDARKQLIVELGGRIDTVNDDRGEIAIGARYQQAFGRRGIWRVDGFATARERASDRYGARFGIQIQF